MVKQMWTLYLVTNLPRLKKGEIVKEIEKKQTGVGWVANHSMANFFYRIASQIKAHFKSKACFMLN